MALIGDLVGSRQLNAVRRTQVQADLSQLLAGFNQRFRGAVLADFVITTGDEFQALLRDPGIIPDLVWELEGRLTALRLGVGLGVLHTPLKPVAIGMDGPAFHAARAGIELAEKRGWLGGVFVGFGESGDLILNGIARLLERHRSGMTRKQRQVAELLRAGHTQTDAARVLGITKQAVSDHVRATGWETYREGEVAWRTALRSFGGQEEPGDVT